jgi:hypothetical protein
MCTGLPVKYLLYSSDFSELEHLTFFEKISNTKCHGNPSCGSQVIPGGWTDMIKLPLFAVL